MQLIKNPVAILALLIFCIVQFSCEDFPRIEFPTVETEDADPEQEGLKVFLRGKINAEKIKDISEWGFVWSSPDEDVDTTTVTFPRSSITQDGPGKFFVFDTLIENHPFKEDVQNYNVRAYIVLRDSIKYGKPLIFNFLTVAVRVGSTEIDNDVAIIEGFIAITDQEDFRTLVDHGHIVSSEDEFPTLFDGCVCTSLGTRDDEGGFLSNFQLTYNTKYYTRAYAVTADRQDTLYSEPKEFELKDGWNKLSDLDAAWSGGVAAAYQNYGILGMGCNSPVFCGSENKPWTLIPQDIESVELIEGVGLPAFQRRNGVGFVIGDIFYFGLGNSNAGISDEFSYMFADTAMEQKWDTLNALFPGVPRHTAVGVVLNDMAYVGFGRDASSGALDDLYSFNPGSVDMWDTVSIPNPYEILGGVFGVTAVAMNGAIYMIGGRTGQANGNKAINNVYEFKPGNAPGQQWKDMTDFPAPSDEERYHSVGFALNGKIYVGLGRGQIENNGFQDFRVFDPNLGEKGTWLESEIMASFPGDPRYYAVALVIKDMDGNEVAYVGSGQNLLNQGLKDLWRYTPVD